ncbi:MAG: hypothetical protein HY401_01785 [Elusimicrobia bacterium]|nr:hypothetical protein [Elusimicrobiota bacterium]
MKKLLLTNLIVLALAGAARANDVKEPTWSLGAIYGVGDINGNEVKPAGVQFQKWVGLGFEGEHGSVGVNLNFIKSQFDNTRPFKNWNRKNGYDDNDWDRVAENSAARVVVENGRLNQLNSTVKELGGVFYRTPYLGKRLALEVGTRIARVNHDPGYTISKTEYTSCANRPAGTYCDSIRANNAYVTVGPKRSSEERAVDAGGPRHGFGQAAYAGINVLLSRPGATDYDENYPGVSLAIELTKSFLGDNRLQDGNYGVRFGFNLTGW